MLAGPGEPFIDLSYKEGRLIQNYIRNNKYIDCKFHCLILTACISTLDERAHFPLDSLDPFHDIQFWRRHAEDGYNDAEHFFSFNLKKIFKKIKYLKGEGSSTLPYAVAS